MSEISKVKLNYFVSEQTRIHIFIHRILSVQVYLGKRLDRLYRIRV